MEAGGGPSGVHSFPLFLHQQRCGPLSGCYCDDNRVPRACCWDYISSEMSVLAAGPGSLSLPPVRAVSPILFVPLPAFPFPTGSLPPRQAPFRVPSLRTRPPGAYALDPGPLPHGRRLCKARPALTFSWLQQGPGPASVCAVGPGHPGALSSSSSAPWWSLQAAAGTSGV